MGGVTGLVGLGWCLEALAGCGSPLDGCGNAAYFSGDGGLTLAA